MNPQKAINNLIYKLENSGTLQRTPAFIYDYEKEYPQFKILEDNADIIQKECLHLLARKEDIPDMNGLVGKKTTGGIHAIDWKTFMFKSGKFISQNCELCPETAKLLKKLPGVKQAFFSILDPEQHIKPHKGYYRGFLRYHLGVLIPENNFNKSCWIRINDNQEDNEKKDKSKMQNGETYYWENGKGIMFNDFYLHEAANESKEIRVVLFLDVVRKLPHIYGLINNLLLAIAYKTNQVKQIQKNALLKDSATH